MSDSFKIVPYENRGSKMVTTIENIEANKKILYINNTQKSRHRIRCCAQQLRTWWGEVLWLCWSGCKEAAREQELNQQIHHSFRQHYSSLNLLYIIFSCKCCWIILGKNNSVLFLFSTKVHSISSVKQASLNWILHPSTNRCLYLL